MDKQVTIINELEEFRTCLMAFNVLRRKIIVEGKRLTGEEEDNLATILDKISIDAGRYGPLIMEITGLEKIHTSAGLQDVWNWALSPRANKIVIYALDDCVTATSRTIGTLKSDIDNGIRDEQGNLIRKQKEISSEQPKCFIAHEGETKALTTLKEFLEALGIQYVIAESKASDSRSIERQVDWAQGEADFTICLATKGKAVNKKTGKHYMGLNIADELGRARQVFQNHIILLVQKGVEVHTNPREIVYENFTTTSMEKAFIKIIRELKNWGYLTTGKTKETLS